MSSDIAKTLAKLLTEALSEPVVVQGMKSLSGGCINQAVKLTTNRGIFFAKWSATAPADQFVREAEALQELAKASTLLQIPRVILVQTDPPLLVTSFLEPATGSTAPPDEQLGRGIAELHRYKHDRYGFHQNNYCGATPQDNRWNDDWIAFYGQQRLGHLMKLLEQKRGLSDSERKAYAQLMDRLPQLVGHHPPPALTHGDLWSGNALYSASGPALIDPACAYADRESDLALMAMFGGFSDRTWAAYQEAYPLPAGWQQRRPLYQLYHYLNHDYLFSGAYGRQALAIAERYG
ncbi:MAG: fructosamine kinase family protein [Tunicatimonas sp.]